jgi:hypothetical protein
MKRKYMITVHGNHKTWGFPIVAPPEHAEDWRADGLEVDEICNSIPLWAAREPMLTIWILAQDFWQWLRLF